MFGLTQLARASWTLADQGVVSLGSFAVNILLARNLPQSEYGAFAIIFAALLLLQVINTTLVFYPLTIRTARAVEQRSKHIHLSLLLLVGGLIPQSAMIAAGLVAFDEDRLIFPALAWFFAWQLQEYLRRVLFAEFRHSVAIVGDSLSYLGQAVGVAGLAAFGMLDLPKVFLTLAATSVLGALIQSLQVRVDFRSVSATAALASTAKDYWSIGRWSLAGSLATAMRINMLVWLIGFAAGRLQVAEFQAALNIINVVNPVLVGLCNLIPQTAAQSATSSISRAWRTTAYYATFGFLPTALYYAFLVVSPAPMLRLLYGGHSEYLAAATAVQILGAAFMLNYVSEMICSFLHGIPAPKIAFNLNLIGTAVTVLAFVPLFIVIGWIAAPVALAIANGMRLLLSVATIKRLIAHAVNPA